MGGTLAFTQHSAFAAGRAALATLPRRQVVLLAADWAALTLPVYEAAHPGDDRPRRAVEAARDGVGDAAYAASYAAKAAASYAAANAAYAAAYAANAAYAAYAAASAASAASYAAKAAASYAAANAAYSAAYAAAAAAAAANAAYSAAAAAAAGWDAVHARWLAAWHGGRAFDPVWRTPLARQLAADPEAYPVLLDHLTDLGADVDGLRGAEWSRSNWAVFHLTEADVLSTRLPEEV